MALSPWRYIMQQAMYLGAGPRFYESRPLVCALNRRKWKLLQYLGFRVLGLVRIWGLSGF